MIDAVVTRFGKLSNGITSAPLPNTGIPFTTNWKSSWTNTLRRPARTKYLAGSTSSCSAFHSPSPSFLCHSCRRHTDLPDWSPAVLNSKLRFSRWFL